MPILNMIAQWSWSGGGGNVGEPTNLQVVLAWTDATIKWTDNNLNSIPPTTFAKSELVRKVGSAPSSPSDWTLMVTETTMNTYQTSGFQDLGLTVGNTYYYTVFSYSTDWAISYCNAVSVTPSTVIPTNWLLWYYPFETDGNDYSGNWNDATVTWCSFGTIWSKAWVRLQTAYDSIPSNYIVSPINYNQTPVTAICWAYGTNLNDWQTIMANTKQDAHPDSANNLRIRSSNTDFLVTVYGQTSNQTTITANTRMMLAITVSGTDWIIYKDWQQIMTFTTGTDNTSTWPRAWWHGERWGNWFHPRVWWIRQSALYNRCLSAQEIEAYYIATS